MAVYNIISLSHLEDETRLDSQYYAPNNMLFEDEIKAFPTVLLGSVAKITDGQHGYFKLDKKSEIRQITAKCIKDGLVDKSNADRLSAITHLKNLRSSLEINDVLVTTAGTIGQIGLVTQEILPANIDQDIGRIAIHSTEVSPFFVWAFLQSKFGQFQLERFTTGQVQTHLSLKKMKKLRIPLLYNHLEIDEIVASFVASKNAAKDLYTQARHLLESELGLDKLSFQKLVGYTARFSEVITNSRCDSDYYQPQFTAVRQIVKNYPHGFELLIHVATPLKPNIDPSKFPDQPYRYIELSNINPSLGSVDGFVSKSGKDLPSRARRQVQHGDVIASAVVGSIDKAAIIDPSQNNYIASTGFFHLRPMQVSSEYLLMLVRSKCVCMQFQQQSTGGILSAVPDSRLKHIIVPKLPERLQREITALIVQSHDAKKKSEELLHRAKTRVEQLIDEAILR